MHPVQAEILRNVTPEQRVRIGMQKQADARNRKAAALGLQHPDWTEEEVMRELARLTLYGGL